MASDSGDPCNYQRELDDESSSDGDSSMYPEEAGGTSPLNEYTVLTVDEIRRRQEELIDTVSGVLSVSRASACILLIYFDWSDTNLNDAWFADQDKVCTTVGIIENQNPNAIESPSTDVITCKICCEDYTSNSMHGIGCGHLYCASCWEGYITSSINNDGAGCLNLRCPHPSCSAAVGQNLVDELVCKEEKEKYAHYLLRSYVEANRTTKWCPAPGCDCAVEFRLSSRSYNVTCNCTHSFCWNCTEEVHTPVDCSTVTKWISKNNAESENNMTWLLANSKPCPNCNRPIEKDHGCMHMTCPPPCYFQFCWLCLGPWSDHGPQMDGLLACNSYAISMRRGELNETEQKREMAKHAIQRYNHYYERWAANHSSRQKAIEDFKKLQDVYMKVQFQFLKEAWLQIIECRRVLKWTYAYGFYLDDNEHAKRRLFEYLQGEAESGLERLHHCVEKYMRVFLGFEWSGGFNFTEYQAKLIDLTNITGKFFDNLVQALENDLNDVEAEDRSWICKDCTYQNAGDDTKCQMCNRLKASWSCEYCTYCNSETAITCVICSEPHSKVSWSCKHCTYYNAETAITCVMCERMHF